MSELVQAISDIFAAILGRFGHVGRPRRRQHIEKDLDLLDRLRGTEGMGAAEPAYIVLREHINAEVAIYASGPNKTAPWSSILIAFLIGASCAYWTYSIVKDGFAIQAIPPGVVAGLMIISIAGMLSPDRASDDDDVSSPDEDAPAAR